MELGKMTRHQLGQINDRLAEIDNELRDVQREEEARNTIIEGEAFSHEAWLLAERDELLERREAVLDTTSMEDGFIGAD